jgi:hypothetical protein
VELAERAGAGGPRVAAYAAHVCGEFGDAADHGLRLLGARGRPVVLQRLHDVVTAPDQALPGGDRLHPANVPLLFEASADVASKRERAADSVVPRDLHEGVHHLGRDRELDVEHVRLDGLPR